MEHFRKACGRHGRRGRHRQRALRAPVAGGRARRRRRRSRARRRRGGGRSEIGGLAVQFDAASESSVQSLIAAGDRGQRADRHLHLQRRRARRHGRPRDARRDLAGSVERQRDGARVGLARAAAADARARRGLSDQHRLRRRAAHAGLLARLQRDQARRRVAGRVAGDRVRRRRHPRVVHLPAGRAHADARTGDGRARGRRRADRPAA